MEHWLPEPGITAVLFSAFQLLAIQEPAEDFGHTQLSRNTAMCSGVCITSAGQPVGIGCALPSTSQSATALVNKDRLAV